MGSPEARNFSLQNSNSSRGVGLAPQGRYDLFPRRSGEPELGFGCISFEETAQVSRELGDVIQTFSNSSKKRYRIIPVVVIFLRICVTGTNRGQVNNMISFFPLDNKALKLKYFSLTFTLALALIIDTRYGSGDSAPEVNEG